MDPMICPHCRRPADRPMFMPKATQQVFNYIWEHPWSSIRDIENALYGNNHSTNLIAVHISKMRSWLTGTPYKVACRKERNNGANPPRQYAIQPVEAPTHANVTVTPSLP